MLKNSENGMTSREISDKMDLTLGDCESILDKMYWKNKIFPVFFEGKKIWHTEI
jgi:hypothetical protein